MRSVISPGTRDNSTKIIWHLHLQLYSPEPYKMKLSSLRTLLVLALAVLWSSTIPGQVLGNTQNVQVRMVTEPWAATASNASFAVGRSTVISAPAHWPKPVSSPAGSSTHSATDTKATSAALPAAG